MLYNIMYILYNTMVLCCITLRLWHTYAYMNILCMTQFNDSSSLDEVAGAEQHVLGLEVPAGER